MKNSGNITQRLEILVEHYGGRSNLSHKTGVPYNTLAQIASGRRNPGLALIIRGDTDRAALASLERVLGRYLLPVRVWTINANGPGGG